ncbi:hypothetical protein WCLP8_4630002 [uncultured Gammaproteobacteria bacterium]
MRLSPLSEADGGGWLAEVPDLPGCMSDGATPEEAAQTGHGIVLGMTLKPTMPNWRLILDQML